MAHMFFITKIEESFGVELTGDEIGQMQTVKEIKRILESKAVK
jgi:acyl carrier protein